MDKQFEQLTKLAKKYDEESNFKQADEITELMIKIAQEVTMPVPTAPPVNKGFFGNIGSAIGEGLGAMGKGIAQGASSAGQAISNTATNAGQAIVKPFQNFQKMNKERQSWEEKKPLIYEVDAATRQILTDTANVAKKWNFDQEEAERKAINLAKKHPNYKNLNEICNKVNNQSFENYVSMNYNTYLKRSIQAYRTGPGALQDPYP
jgi:hypothetical protein